MKFWNFNPLAKYNPTWSTKGQLISKGLFAILEFFQKMNETIRS